VLFVHWLGHVASNRTEFLPDAIELAKRGTVSLLVNAMWSEPGWFSRRKLEDDYEFSIRQLIDLRRALDLLLSQSNIDPDRIGYVGHDFGAMFGAILAGVDDRPRAYVLMAGTDDFNNWYQLNRSRFPEGYEEQIGTLAPTCFIGRIADVPVLFQFAENDRYVSPENAQRFFDAANEPKEMIVYETEHSFEGDEDAVTDRLDWLVEYLGLAPAE
jgi:cephalosporin-C deacetylase-like acetyl esterase